MDLHVFPILNTPPTSLPIPSLWVNPVYQPWTLVSWIQPRLLFLLVPLTSPLQRGVGGHPIPVPENQTIQISQFNHSVVYDSLRPHELQHARPPCPSPTPGVYSNSCPSNLWCHPTISSSVVSFSSSPQRLPASGSFPMSQLFSWSCQSMSFNFNISPFNEHPGLISFRMDWLDMLTVQGTLKSLLQHDSSKASILQCSAFFKSNSHIHTWLLEKP